MQITDNFARANGPLGGNWGPVIPNNADTAPPTFAGGILINGNGYGPISAAGGDAASLYQGVSFQNNQFAMATVNSSAGFEAVLHITAATQSGGNTTYTYTTTSGSVAAQIAFGILCVYISGMQNAGNNGNFVATTFGSGTFTVANATGVTEAGSNGTGNCPSDSGAGVLLRASGSSASNLNGYFFHTGTNSINGNGRVGFRELWKIVNGVGTVIGPQTASAAPVIGDQLALLIVGSTLTAFYNGAVWGQVTDTSISSGGPGITAWSLNGAQEYNWSNWTNYSTATGNNGTTLNNYIAGDFNWTYTQLASDPFTEGTSLTQVASDAFQRGTQASLGPNWFTNSPDSGTGFQLSSNLVETTSNGTHNYAYWSGNGQTFNENQYSEITIKTNAASNFFGPGVRMQSALNHGGTGANGDGYLLQVGTALGSSGSIFILKRVNNSQTVLATYTAVTVNTGDVLRISVSGTSISATKNGVSLGAPATDSSIVSGFPGFWMDTTAAANCQISAWDAGGVGAPSTFSTGLNQNFQSDATVGVFNTVLDATTSNGYGALWQNAVSWPNDQYSEATITGSSAGSGSTGPGVRISSTQDSAYWFSPISGSLARLTKNVNGTATALSSVSYTFNTGDVFRIEVIGTSIICKINGVPVIVASDSSLTSGNAGIVSLTASGSTSAGSYSTWDAGSITAPAPPVSGAYSVPDCRNFGNFPNASRLVQGTKIYDVQTSSNSAVPGTDSRAAGAPVDSRASGNAPQNSRTPGTFGPGE